MYYQKFGISNFRCINDQTDIEIRPITLNIGPNNSGKSTLLKSLELLRRSSLNNQHNSQIISAIKSRQMPELGSPTSFLFNNQVPFSYFLYIKNEDLPSELNHHEVKIKISYKFKTISNLSGNSKTDAYLDKEGIITQLDLYINKELTITFYTDILDQVHSYQNGNADYYSNGYILITNNLYFGLLFNTLTPLKFTTSKFPVEFPDNTFVIPKELISFFSNTLYKYHLKLNKCGENLLTSILEQVVDFQDKISSYQFINLKRTSEKRYIDQSDEQLFENCLSLFHEGAKFSDILPLIDKLFVLFDIPKHYKISHSSDYGYQIQLSSDKVNYRNIKDYGSGINQLLTILLTILNNRETDALSNYSILKINNEPFSSSLIIVEEPESNLHPNYQTKLADMFLFLNQNLNLNFLIETHSEYLIRRFQVLIAKKQINPEDLVINYFWKDPVRSTRICKQIYFKENGRLSDSFEKGFFDETISTQLNLLKLNTLN